MNVIVIGNNPFYKENFDKYIKDKKNISVNYLKDEDFKKKTILQKIKSLKPKFVIVFSGLSGGIFYNIKNYKKILEYNAETYLKILSVLKLCEIKKVFFISASCTYPKNLSILNHDDFLKPNIERTSLAYASSKMIGSLYCYKVNYENKKNQWMTIVPATIYGQKVTKNNKHMHVINAMISKFMFQKKKISFFGTGNVKREFIHIQDLINGIFFIDKKKIFYPIINIGVGYDIKIRRLSKLIAKIVKFKGEIFWKKIKYEGSKKKLLNTDLLFDKGWAPLITLENGIKKIINME
jgi:GDP-L-fucose synthase